MAPALASHPTPAGAPGASAGADARPRHFFTVDVEEYFQVNAFEQVVTREQWPGFATRVERAVETILDLLARHDARGTFFTLGWIADRRPSVVKRIAAAGHEIASHGWWHRKVTALDRPAFAEDARTSKDLLEQVSGQPVRGYRAPSFSIVPGREWALDALAECGYTYDSSLFPIRRPGYGYPSARTEPHRLRLGGGGALVEFPLATWSIGPLRIPAAGGGYFRQFPYAVIRRAFAEHDARGTPAVFYIHPWELDAGQPRLAVPWLTRVRHYRGLSLTVPRLERLLGEFRFGAMADWMASPAASALTPVALTA